MSKNPAKLAKLDNIKGCLKPNFDAGKSIHKPLGCRMGGGSKKGSIVLMVNLIKLHRITMMHESENCTSHLH